MRTLRAALGGLRLLALYLLLPVGALLASAAYHTQLPLARRVVADWLEDVASREIRGTLVISRFERLTPAEISARGVTLFDGDGRRIADAKRLVLRPDWSEVIRERRLIFGSARLENATVRLVDEGHGLPTLLTTFDAQTPSPPGAGGEPLHVTINDIDLQNVTLLGDLLGLNGFRAEDLHAHGQLDIGRDVRARIDHAHATLTQPFGYPAVIDRLNGRISTAASEGVVLHTRAHRGDERVRGTVRYAAPKNAPNAEQRLQIRVRGHALSVSTLHGLGYDWVPNLAVPVSGQLVIEGPVRDLALQAALDTQAGKAAVSGTIASDRGVSVTLRSDGLALAQLFADYPRVTARGLLRIDAPRGAPVPAIHAEVEPLVYDTIAVPGFNLDGAIVAKGVRIDRMQAQSKSARITGHGRIENDGALELDMHAVFPEISDDPNLRHFMPDAHGRLEAALQIGSEQIGKAKLRFAGSIKLTNLRYDLLRADRLELRGSARGDPDHPRVDLKVSGAQVKLGEYVLGDPSLTLAGGPRDYAADGQFTSAGKRTFNVHAQVHAQPDGFMIDADPIEFSVGDGSWRGAMQGLHVIRTEAVELGLLRFANRSQRLEAHGVLRFHGDDQLQAELQNFDLAALRALLGTRLGLTAGFADAHLELSGDIADPQLLLQGALREGVVKDVHDLGALYLITYRDGRIEVSGEVDLGARGLLRVDGSGEIDRTLPDPEQALTLGSYQLVLTAQGLDLSLLPAARSAGVHGALGGELSWSGTLQHPEFDGTIELDQLVIAGGSQLAVRAEGGYADGELRARFSVGDEHGALASAGAEMQLDWAELGAKPDALAHALAQGPWQISGETSERRLDRMPLPLSKLAPYPLALATRFELRKQQGLSSGSVSFTSRWDQPVTVEGCAASVRAQARGRIVLDHGTSHATLAVVADNVEVGHLDISVDTPVDRWAEQGRVESPQLLRANGQLDVADMQKVPYACEYGSGRLQAHVELERALTDNPSLAVTIDSQFSPRVMHQQGRTQRSARGCEDDPIRMHVYASADGKSLSGSGQMQGCHGGTADLAGRMPVRWDRLRVLPTPRDDEEVQGLLRFDGAHLEPLLDRIPGVLNATAIARGEVSLSGPCSAVRTGGQIDVSDGRMYLVATGQELSDISARFDFRGDWAKLEYLHANAGKGELDANGGIGFDDLRPNRVRIAVRVRKLPIKREGVETAQITGSAALDADIQREITHVVVDLHSLDIRLPETSNRVLQTLDPNPDVTVVTRVETAPEKSYPIEFVIHGGKRINVRRNDFEATVTTELAVHYASPELNVGGYIAFSGGEFEVFGKRFEINSGALRFDGGSEFDPDVYLSATEKPQAAGLSPVSVSVTGTLSEPVVTFSSDVCPGEMGAITYLVSGHCAADDPDLAQESADAQGAFASGIVGGVLTLGAQRQLKGIAPRIAVGRTEQGGQRVAAGFSTESLIPKFMRKLVHRVYVEGGVSGPPSSQTGGTENTTQTTALEFLIELYFPHNIVGSGRFGAETSWTVDVIWEP